MRLRVAAVKLCRGIGTSSVEENGVEWKEIRARVDSIANAIFLIAGGALSISIGILLGEQGRIEKMPHLKNFVIWAWWLLLYTMVWFVLLKGNLIVQAYHLLERPKMHTTFRTATIRVSWFLALSGLVSLVAGMGLLVCAASELLAPQ